MKKKQKLSYFLLGVLVTVLITSLAVPTLAALSVKSIEVETGVGIYVNDEKLIPKDANGNTVEVFIYNGTTYLPARAMSSVMGMPIQWEEATTSVYIGSHVEKPHQTTLSQLIPASGNKLTVKYNLTDNSGLTRSPVISNTDINNVYQINGQYVRMDGTWFLPEGYKNNAAAQKLLIYGDGKILGEYTVSSGVMPISFDINLTGIQELSIKTSSGGQANALMTDAKFYID